MLTEQLPPNAALVTASAAAWKTEELGFEVSGRVEFVAEQNTEIDGRIRDLNGQLITEGTPIARIERERYELAVATAKASVARAEQDLAVAQTDLDETIPAQIDAAKASADLARIEFDRTTRLRAQNAASQGTLDSAKATYENAFAELKQLLASEKTQKAQIESLNSALLQAQQGLRDAIRDLEDCTLFSSFRGQVAETAVVPGSLVTAGSPVVTLQMMDPIKVELEVSAEQSRKLQRAETLPVHVTMPDGQVRIVEGFLHQIDPSADPLTRTFTLTILVLNQLVQGDISIDAATTRDIWRLDLKFIPGASEGDLYVEESAILEDATGPYLWQITNATIQSRAPNSNTFRVRKLRVAYGPSKVPYLGDLVFQQVLIDDESFDPQQNLVIGELICEETPANEWQGGQVILSSPSRWMLRPGDLVEVDLSRDDRPAGYYVPMDAIARRADQSFLFAIKPDASPQVVERLEVEVVEDTFDGPLSQLRRIVAADDEPLEGVRYVTSGTHFLVDGEHVIPSVDVESVR